MPRCLYYENDDGSRGFVCGKITQEDLAQMCDFYGVRWHRYLCDRPVMRAGKQGTCDRKICAYCRTRVGPNLDACPDHYVVEVVNSP